MKAFMGLKYTLLRQCGAGHTTPSTVDVPLSPLHTIVPQIMEALQTRATREKGNSPSITIEDYLNSLIPTHAKPQPFHRSEPPLPCTQPHCSSMVVTTAVQTFWPAILHITPDAVNARDTSRCCRFLHNIIIHDNDGNEITSSVHYSLVGKVQFQPPVHQGAIGHYVTYIWVHGACFLYDDLAAGGRLTRYDDTEELLLPDKWSAFYIYARDQTGRDVVSQSFIELYISQAHWYTSPLRHHSVR